MPPKNSRHLPLLIYLCLMALQTMLAARATAQIEIDSLTFGVFPPTPSTFHPLTLTTTNDFCRSFNVTDAVSSIDHERKVIRIDYRVQGSTVDITPCPQEVFVEAFNIPIGELKAPGRYRLDFFESSDFRGSYDLTVEEGGPQYWAETPQQGSIQSGIGIVRGWACHANSIEIAFNDEPRQTVAYGDSRTDTLGACGDENNGYGWVVGWGNLGLGSHRMRTYIDGVEVADVEFEVVGFDEPFIREVSGSYSLDDFPIPGQSTNIQWQEAEQKFIVVE